jgi:hypothetical protein
LHNLRSGIGHRHGCPKDWRSTGIGDVPDDAAGGVLRSHNSSGEYIQDDINEKETKKTLTGTSPHDTSPLLLRLLLAQDKNGGLRGEFKKQTIRSSTRRIGLKPLFPTPMLDRSQNV